MTFSSKLNTRLGAALIIVLAALSTGCAGTQARSGVGDPDPAEPVNRVFYSINDNLDRFFIKPLAQGYVNVTPQPVRAAVTNFFDNLSYLNVILNSFLQGKVNDGFSDVGRFVVNSTLGIGGLFDVATDMGLPRHDEDLGQTLAVWGATQGSYLYLPVRGPQTVRDLPNIASSTLLNPLFYVSGTVLFPITALNVINIRANLLDETNIRDEAAVDPYSFTREAYIQRREYLIYDGNPPTEGYDAIFDEEAEDDSRLIIE